MKTRKRIFDILFIVVSAIILMVLLEYGLMEKYIGFALIPILIAYQLGQYSERKFRQ
jgi:TctA family transporter